MSIAAILAAIGAIGAIATAVTYLIKTGIWAFKKTESEKGQAIDKTVQDEKHDVEAGGRPKWD